MVGDTHYTMIGDDDKNEDMDKKAARKYTI